MLKRYIDMKIFILFLLYILCIHGEEIKTYVTRDEVLVIANIVRPYANPTETYQYYKLPYCKPKDRQWDDHALGELLTGSRKVVTDYHLYFGVDQDYAILCKLNITKDIMNEFKKAIDEDYIFEIYFDDIQLLGQVGTAYTKSVTLTNYYLHTHLHFDVGYNGPNEQKTGIKINGQIVEANITSKIPGGSEYNTDHQYLLTEENIIQNKYIIFSYSIKWHYKPYLTWENRLKTDDTRDRDLQIHWLSIINSFVLIMLLIIFLSIIMIRILKRDFSRYMSIEDETEKGEQETGWKLIYADVFRVPPNINLFSAFVGAGAQLFFMLTGVLLLSLMDIFHPSKRGAVLTSIIILYALTSGFGGYISATLYKQLGGQNWVRNIVLCTFIVPGPLLAIFSFLNTVAIWNDSSAALPFGTIMIVLALFTLVTLPLTIIGGIAGKNISKSMNVPCRTSKIPREIPKSVAYRHPILHIFAAGCLPFSAVYIELHHILAAIWGHQIYTLFGILFLAFIMLIFVTGFMTIALTYFQLAAEDHQWWWRSFISGGITGLFIFIYSIWYYYTASEMTGFFQASFFFGYMAMISYCFFVMLGFIGYQSSIAFVLKIYRTIKVE